MGIHKSYFYYESEKDDSEVEAVIRQKAGITSEGFWKIFNLIRNVLPTLNLDFSGKANKIVPG